jgi:hypothetical protein
VYSVGINGAPKPVSGFIMRLWAGVQQRQGHALEGGGIGLPDDLAAQDAVPVDEVRDRNRDDAEAPGYGRVVVQQGRVGVVDAFDEAPHVFAILPDVDRKDFQALVVQPLVDRFQIAHLPPAERTPVGPEPDRDHRPPQVCQSHRASFEALKVEPGSGFAAYKARTLAAAANHQHHQHPPVQYALDHGSLFNSPAEAGWSARTARRSVR